MIIATDWDCVLNNLIEKALSIYNKKTGKSITIDTITTFNLYDCLEQEDADGITKLFKTKTLWDALTPIKGSQKGLKALVDAGHKVYIATATASDNFDWKMQFLKKYFPFFNPDNVIRIMDKSILKADILIEDNMDQLINHKLCTRICLDYPWNRHGDGKDFVYGIHRCNNWSEILEVINQIEEE